jgi:hypothetical protein
MDRHTVFYPPAIYSGGHSEGSQTVTTNVARVLKASLHERMRKVLVREAARAAAKEAAVRQIDDETLRAIARITLFLLEEADTRSWQILPAFFTVAFIPVAQGDAEITLEFKERGRISLPGTAGPGRFRFFAVTGNGRLFSAADLAGEMGEPNREP